MNLSIVLVLVLVVVIDSRPFGFDYEHEDDDEDEGRGSWKAPGQVGTSCPHPLNQPLLSAHSAIRQLKWGPFQIKKRRGACSVRTQENVSMFVNEITVRRCNRSTGAVAGYKFAKPSRARTTLAARRLR